MTLKLINSLKNKAFICCESCDTYYDLWRDEDLLKDHKKCKWRYVNDEEFKECLEECKEWCFNREN